MKKEIKIPEHIKILHYCNKCEKKMKKENYEKDNGFCFNCSNQKRISDYNG